MLVARMWQWWYSVGWMAAARGLSALLKRQLQEFSVPMLLKTLLAPWKQTVNVAGPDTPLQVRLQWWIGNQISRFIGLLIRLITLTVSLVVVGLTAIVGSVLLLSWFVLPVGSFVLIIFGAVSLWL